MRVLEFVCVYWSLYAWFGICVRVLEFVCVVWNLYSYYVFELVGHRNYHKTGLILWKNLESKFIILMMFHLFMTLVVGLVF